MSSSAASLTLVPRSVRPAPEPLGLYFRVGRKDHPELLDLIAAGETRFFGLVVEAGNVKFQKELIERAVERRLEVILDPRTQPSATVGGFNETLGKLPWGRGRVHVEEDFEGEAGKRLMAEIAQFAAEHGCTQVLTPSHVLRAAGDEWLDLDRRSTFELRDALDRLGCTRVSVLSSLAISYAMLRDPAQRRAVIRASRNLPIEGIWLAVDGLGSNSTPTAVRSYIEAVADFHALDVPMIADHAGGVVGLSFAAFGAVGGLAHGVTVGERFDTTHWRRPRGERSFGLSSRVYVPALDMLLKPAEARMLFGFGRRAAAAFGCHDRKCCTRGMTDMLQNPAQHFLRQRIDEISKLSFVPESLRANRFIDQRLRSTTDAVLTAATLEWKDQMMAKRMNDQRKRLDRMRVTLGNLAEESAGKLSVALAPPRRVVRLAAAERSSRPS